MAEKLNDIAAKICAHMKRLEADAGWNMPDGRKGRSRLFSPYAHASGNRVFCTYISYQGQHSLTKAQALAYLAKLDAGFKGRHFEALREPNGEPSNG